MNKSACSGMLSTLIAADMKVEASKTTIKRAVLPASAAIKRIEVMRMIRTRQCVLVDPGVTGEIRFVNRAPSV